MEKKRITYIDLGKALGILLVTWGHITKLGNPVDTWGNSFKLSIFFITAGYLVCYMDSYRDLTLKNYVWKLFKSLMIPYITFSVLSIGFRFISMVLKHSIDMSAIKSYIFATVTLRGSFALWFLPALFFGEILFFCVMKYLPNWSRFFIIVLPPIGMVVIAGIMPKLQLTMAPLMYERISFLLLPIGKVLIALWFLYIGYLGCKIHQKIQNKNIWFITGIVLSIMTMFTAQLNPGVDINMMRIGPHWALFLLNGIIGSFGALFIFAFLEDYCKFPILNFFGKNSLILMVTQRPFYIISMAQAGWRIFSGMPGVMGRRYYFDCFGILIVVLIVEYAVITFINEKGKFLIGRF